LTALREVKVIAAFSVARSEAVVDRGRNHNRLPAIVNPIIGKTFSGERKGFVNSTLRAAAVFAWQRWPVTRDRSRLNACCVRSEW